jgi:hypothetical protein
LENLVTKTVEEKDKEKKGKNEKIKKTIEEKDKEKKGKDRRKR